VSECVSVFRFVFRKYIQKFLRQLWGKLRYLRQRQHDEGVYLKLRLLESLCTNRFLCCIYLFWLHIHASRPLCEFKLLDANHTVIQDPIIGDPVCLQH